MAGKKVRPPRKNNRVVRGLFTLPLALSVRSVESRAVGSLPLEEFIGGSENAMLDVLFRRPLSELLDAPLLLHGQSGVGKTALVRALVARFCATNDSKQALVLPAVDLVRHPLPDRDRTTEASATGPTRRLIVIEDIHHLSRRTSGQRSLQALIDTSLSTGDGLVMTSALPPGELRHFDLAIRSRLCGGLVVPVLPPRQAARQEIVQQFSSRRHLLLDPDTKAALVGRDTLTGRELIAALMQIETMRKADAPPSTTARPEVPLSVITRFVARDAGLRMKDLRGPSRRRTTVRWRAAAMYLARRLTALSLQNIGHYFGHRDHTTVLHACRSIEQQRKVDDEWSRNLHELETVLIRGATSSSSVQH